MKDIQDTIKSIRKLLRETTKVSDEAGVDIDAVILRDKEDVSKRNGWVRFGDYELNFYDDDVSLEYRPIGKGHSTNEWRYSLSDEQLVSFTMPPKEKRPAAGQSKQSVS